MPLSQEPATLADHESLTGAVNTAFSLACAAFLLQACLHTVRAWTLGPLRRAQQHEQLSAAANGTCALVYYAMYCGVFEGLYTSGGDAAANGRHTSRIIFWISFVGRADAISLVLVNLSALARERRPPVFAVGAVWVTQTASLCLGHLVDADKGRLGFLVIAVALLLPLSSALIGSMGARLRLSHLQVVHRFLASWCVLCSACYCLAFFCCAYADLFSTETEMMVYTLLDYCTVGVSCIVVSCAGPEIETALLPAQEEELSLYPGPHTHGFYPNVSYYEDHL